MTHSIKSQLKSSVFETLWGWVASTFGDSGLVALTLPQDTRKDAIESLADQTKVLDLAIVRNPSLAGQVNGYFEGRRKSFDITVDLSLGTQFQREVWKAAMEVPYGEQRSYSWIAGKICSPLAMRAVGHALGSNPIAVVVPCHRILRSDGGLGGYGGGLPMKRRLLKLEGMGNTSQPSTVLLD
ncbi:MAG: methylated-DNA--[protein]-cysteine S-methyltransferase [Dehalococcoidia bacterium]|nr:methylated-DNA--[protein]-cysteine S-methyltransferase [Dehalococcoidia bacterium]